MKSVKSISYKKIHPERGLAYTDFGIIHIEKSLVDFEQLYVTVHEIIHCQNPTWSEIKVIGHSTELAELLWQQGYRKTKQ